MLNEDLTKTLKSADRVKVARVIADMLGVENAESMSPDVAVNTGLRKIKTKRMTAEFVATVKKMVQLAQEVGIKVDHNAIPVAVTEDVVNKDSTYNSAKDVLRFKDFKKLEKLNKGIVPADSSVPLSKNGTVFGEQTDVPAPEEDEKDTIENIPQQVGHSMTSPADDHLRRRKVQYKLGEWAEKAEAGQLEEDQHSADYKVSTSGRKYRARHINFANSNMGGDPSRPEEEEDGTKKHVKNDPVIKPVKEEVEDQEHDNISTESDIDDMVSGVDTEEDIIDLYDEDELCIVDQETGEVVEDVKEEVQQIDEVMTRMERMRAKVRFARTASKRERRLQIALKSRSTTTKINKRARTLAVKLMKQRLIKKPLAQMTVSEKERAEKIIARRKALINRLAMKLAPRIRKIENARLSHSKVTK